MKLEDSRKRIDETDARIVRLIAQRISMLRNRSAVPKDSRNMGRPGKK